MDSVELAPVFRIDSHTGRSIPYDFGDVAKIATEELAGIERDELAEGQSMFLSELYRGVAVDRETGVSRAWLAGERGKDVSDEEFLVLIGGFGVEFDEMLRLGEYLRRVGSALGVRDSWGREVGMLILDPISRPLQSRLSNQDIADIRGGDLSSWGGLLQKTIENWMVSKGMSSSRMGIIGYSLGSSLSPVVVEQIAKANEAAEKVTIQVGSLTLGALTNPVPGAINGVQFAARATKESRNGSYTSDAPAFFVRGQTRTRDIVRGMVTAPRLNAAIPSALSNQRVLSSVIEGMRAFPDMDVNMGVGCDDSMGTMRLMTPALMELSRVSGRSLNILCAEGKAHCWARDLRLLGAIAGTGMIGFQTEGLHLS